MPRVRFVPVDAWQGPIVNQYNTGVLVGNWFEDRLEHARVEPPERSKISTYQQDYNPWKSVLPRIPAALPPENPADMVFFPYGRKYNHKTNCISMYSQSYNHHYKDVEKQPRESRYSHRIDNWLPPQSEQDYGGAPLGDQSAHVKSETQRTNPIREMPSDSTRGQSTAQSGTTPYQQPKHAITLKDSVSGHPSNRNGQWRTIRHQHNLVSKDPEDPLIADYKFSTSIKPGDLRAA